MLGFILSLSGILPTDHLSLWSGAPVMRRNTSLLWRRCPNVYVWSVMSEQEGPGFESPVIVASLLVSVGFLGTSN